MSVGTFAGVFALMFLLELPDKTMVATIVMSTRARPGPIWLGASCAFIVQMALAVTVGGLLTLLPHTPKDVIVGVLFLGGAAYLLLVPQRDADVEGEREAAAEHPGSRRREAATAFAVIFVGEFGDLTQIQAANLAARTHAPVGVFFASSLALVLVAAVGAYGGRMLQRVVPLRAIRAIGGLVFLGLGAYTLVQAAGG
ncbi:MAG: TMEM165/GDT1 family protein [Acidimicrobiales bacterium]